MRRAVNSLIESTLNVNSIESLRAKKKNNSRLENNVGYAFSLYNINKVSRTQRAVHTLHKLTKVEADWANLHSHVEYLSIRESFHWNNFLVRHEKSI